jgi:hypothetical protein
MNTIKKIQLIALLVVNASLLFGCNNPNSSASEQSTGEQSTVTESSANETMTKGSPVQAELDKAKKTGKVVFLVVTGTGDTEADKALAIAKTANSQFKNSSVIKLNKDDSLNIDLVTKLRLSGAPVPLILVISPKGIAVGGYLLAEATAELLVKLIPSPKMDDIYAALNDGNAVFIVFSKKSYTDRLKVMDNCKAAAAQLQAKSTIIEIDLDDKKESDFIQQLKLKNTPNTTTTLVLNAAGQTTGSFEGIIDVAQLTTAAKKVIKGGCGGGACCPR